MIETRRAIVAAWIGVLVAVLASRCDGAGAATMVHIEPPRDWAARIAHFREMKDQFFRSSPDSPLLAEHQRAFGSLEYFEPDPSLYFVGSIEPYAEPEPLQMVTTAGVSRPAERFGRVQFAHAGLLHTLQVYRLLDTEPAEGPEEYFLPFSDATSGTETYPAGRYLEFTGTPGGPYVLDFNMAFNPSCAYGDPARFACPRAPAENRLGLRIEAGERGFSHSPS